MGGDERFEVAERKSRSVMWRADGAEKKCVLWNGIGAELFAAFDLRASVETCDALADEAALAYGGLDAISGGYMNGVENLRLACAPAQDAAECAVDIRVAR